MKKILAVSSSGGHWVQLLRLQEKIFNNYETVYVGTNKGMESSLKGEKYYAVMDCNINKKLKLLVCFVQLLLILMKEKPDVIITTGAAPGLLSLISGKILFKKTIWIDSLANTKKLSVSGKYAKYFTNLWLTQWEEVVKKSDDKKLKYKGKLI